MRNDLTLTPPHCWLWPDHLIGRSESRQLRDEHNELVNAHAQALTALKVAKDFIHTVSNPGEPKGSPRYLYTMQVWNKVCAAIPDATGTELRDALAAAAPHHLPAEHEKAAARLAADVAAVSCHKAAYKAYCRAANEAADPIDQLGDSFAKAAVRLCKCTASQITLGHWSGCPERNKPCAAFISEALGAHSLTHCERCGWAWDESGGIPSQGLCGTCDRCKDCGDVADLVLGRQQCRRCVAADMGAIES